MDTPASRLFLVERYDDTGTPDLTPIPAPPSTAHVVCALRVPADDVVIALVEWADPADQADAMGEQMMADRLVGAGWRVDRVTTATWLPAQEGTR